MLNKKFITISGLIFIILNILSGAAFSLETKPDPENYGKTAIFQKKYLDETLSKLNKVKEAFDDPEEFDIDDLNTNDKRILLYYTPIENAIKEDISLEPKRLAYIKKYNLPSYVTHIRLDSNKHDLKQINVGSALDVFYYLVNTNRKFTYDDLNSIFKKAHYENPKNKYMPTVDTMDTYCTGIYRFKFKDRKKTVPLKDVIIKLVEAWAINYDYVETVLSYNDNVKYPELKNVPDYERRFLNFAFDNKIYKRVKPVNLNSTLTVKQALDLFNAAIIKKPDTNFLNNNIAKNKNPKMVNTNK